jgi:hypothetical protein
MLNTFFTCDLPFLQPGRETSALEAAASLSQNLGDDGRNFSPCRNMLQGIFVTAGGRQKLSGN